MRDRQGVRRAASAAALAVLVLLLAPAAEAVSPQRGHFPLSFTGVVSWHRNVDDGPSGVHEVDDWSVQLTLQRTHKTDDQAAYSGEGTGTTVEVGTCCGGCSWQAGPFDFTVEAEVLIQPSQRSPTGFVYYFHGGSPLLDVPYKVTCPVRGGNDPPTVRSAVGWQTDERPFSGPNLNGQLESLPDPQVHGVTRWQLNGTPDPDDLKANPGGPYKVTRAHHVTLNGSGSTGKIVSYRWRLGPGADCRGALKQTAKAGVTWGFVPLCSLHATLTVADKDGNTDSASTTVEVAPRDWQTPDVKHNEKRTEDSRINDPPFMHPGEDYGDKNGGIVIGLNVSSCRTRSRSLPWLCPDASAGHNRGKRYTLAKVGGGPFDGFFYVASAPLTIERTGILNYWFLPGGPIVAPGQPNFYDYNKAHGADVGGFIAAASAHEGMGVQGRLETGHSSRLQAWISVPNRDNDPRRILEAEFGPTADGLEREVDEELTRISTALFVASRDPLPEIWTGKLWLYDPEVGKWVQEDWSVPSSP